MPDPMLRHDPAGLARRDSRRGGDHVIGHDVGNLDPGAVIGRDGDVAGDVPFGHQSDKLALIVGDNQATHIVREHFRRGLFDAIAMADTGDLGMTISGFRHSWPLWDVHRTPRSLDRSCAHAHRTDYRRVLGPLYRSSCQRRSFTLIGVVRPTPQHPCDETMDATVFLVTGYDETMGKAAGNSRKSVTLLGAAGTYLHNGNDGKHNKARYG